MAESVYLQPFKFFVSNLPRNMQDSLFPHFGMHGIVVVFRGILAITKHGNTGIPDISKKFIE